METYSVFPTDFTLQGYRMLIYTYWLDGKIMQQYSLSTNSCMMLMYPIIRAFNRGVPGSLRALSTSQFRLHESISGPDIINVTIITKDGIEERVKGKVGERLLYLAHRHGIDMEGSCEASLACTTCHVYVENHEEKLPEPTEEEDDLLDQAPFLELNSRLGCQIVMKEELSGIVVRLPQATRNFYVDGHKPQPH
ncbi:2Fe-2S ferredoxin [Lepeophtheirus salmonis]|uniref:2Fe-2S ferredoxin n=1 Tax=Lepeophtheirus salmonis TaxID=72036 RepID=UPI003AF40737